MFNGNTFFVIYKKREIEILPPQPDHRDPQSPVFKSVLSVNHVTLGPVNIPKQEENDFLKNVE